MGHSYIPREDIHIAGGVDMKRVQLIPILLVFNYLPLVLVADAYAYLDPASGSILLQTLIAVLLGIGVAFRHFRYKFMSVVRKLFSRTTGLKGK